MSELNFNIRGAAKDGEFTVAAGVVGLDRTKAALRQWAERATALLAEAMNSLGELVMGDAKLECPVDTGALRASGYVMLVFTARGVFVVIIGFGGVAVPYALYQHETLSLHHAVGKSKYLEDPFRRRVARADVFLSEYIEQRLAA